jgi:hypothetical protein
MTISHTARPKRSWPLLTLAASAFIPAFGFISGSIAVAWGLLSSRPRAKLAVAIGGLGALLQVVAGITLAWWAQNSPTVRETQAIGVARDLKHLVSDLDAFHDETGHYPATLLELVGKPIPIRMAPIYDQSAGLFRQRLYEYRPASDGQTFDLFSIGPDGEPGTADDIRPALPDSVLRASGYRPSR